MRKGLPKGLVKSNLYLPGREVAKLDFLRTETEASSDSEVIRQALRHFEQLLLDEKHGVYLKVVNGAGEALLTSSRFRDRPEGTKDLTRRSLILHKQSERRLEKLRVAMDAKDVSEVVRCALRFFEEIVSAAAHGAQFFVVFPSGEKLGVRFGSVTPTEPSGIGAPERIAEKSQPPDPEWSGGLSTEPELVTAPIRSRAR